MIDCYWLRAPEGFATGELGVTAAYRFRAIGEMEVEGEGDENR
jgi:hypothetical protein